MTFNDVPIRRKLTASMLLTATVVVVLMQGAFFIYGLFELQKNTAQRLSTLGEITATNLTAALAFENQRDAQEILGALKAERHIVAAAIYDADNRVFVQYSQDSLPNPFPSAPGAPGYRLNESNLEGFEPIAEHDRRLGTLYLKFDIGSVEHAWLSGSLRISLTVIAVMLLIAYFLSQMLQRQISQPLLTLAGTVKDISAHQDFSIRAEKHGKDEIGQLTDGFNEMLAGIQQREDALRTANEALLAENEERNRAQHQLARAQKMEAVGQLTGGLAHDFNNILGVIIGNLDMVGENLPADSLAHHPCNEALEAALSAAELVKRLLAFSRRQPLRPKPTSLSEVIANVQPLLARTLGEQIRITTASSPSAWLAMADPGQIESAILNLAINARDAMPTGGDLRIEQRDITIDADYALAVDDLKLGDYAVLTVTDTGIGMPPDVVARAFDPFFTTKAPGAGSGLGLSMVFGTMRQLGGTARIYSEPGRGTTVMLYLPRASGEESDAAATAALAPIPGGSEYVLMVEDNAQIRAIGAGILRSLGYHVVVAENADDAMRQVEHGQHFDVLFSDIVMAGRLNGIALARELRKRKPGLPVLLTSGFTSPATAHSDLTDLGAELITKPYRKAELAGRLRAVLDGPPNAVT